MISMKEESTGPLLSVGRSSSSFSLPDDVLEERAFKYKMALANADPDVDQIKSLLASNNEAAVRTEALVQEQTERKGALAKLIELNPEAPTENLNSLRDSIVQLPSKDTILEKRYAEAAFGAVLADSSNVEEVSEAGATELSQTMYDFLVDEQTRAESFKKIYEDRVSKNKAMSWGQWSWDFAESFIPLYSYSTQVNDTLGERLSSWLPSNNLQEQYDYIRSLPTEEAVALVKKIDEEMGAANSFEVEQWLSRLIAGYSTEAGALDNLFFGLDVGGIAAPFASLGRKALSSTLKASTRIRAAETATKDYIKQKEALNHITPKRMPSSVGDLNSEEWLRSAPVVERLRRTRAVLSQPNAKLDHVLAGVGKLDEASKALASRLLPKAGASQLEETKRIADMVPMLSRPDHWLIDASLSHTSRAVDILDVMKRNVDLFTDAFSKTLNVSRIPAVLEREALSVAAKKLSEEANQNGINKAILGTIEKYESQSSGLNRAYVEAKFGALDRTLFSSVEEADNTALNRYGFAKGSYDIVQEGDGYAIAVQRDIDELEAIKTADYSKDPDLVSKIEKEKILGFIPKPAPMRFVHGAKETLSNEQNAQRFAVTNAQAALSKYFEAMQEPLNKLSKREVKALKRVLDANRRTEKIPGDPSSRGKFYENSAEFEEAYIEINKRLPTNEETAAYASMVQQSQMDYVFRSLSILKYKARRNVVEATVSLNKKSITFEGIELDKLPTQTIHNAGVGVWDGKKVVYKRLNEQGFVESANKLVKDKGYRVVHVYDPEDADLAKSLGVTGLVNYLVVPNLKKGVLRWSKQLNYNPGGHIKYTPENLVKQARFIRDSSGRRVYTGDTVAFGASSSSKAMKEAQLLEKARLAIKSKDKKALQEAIKEGLPYTEKKLVELFKTRFDPDIPFSVVKSGQSSASRDVKTVNGKALFEEIGDFDDFSNSPHNLQRKETVEFSGPRDGPLYSIKEAGTEENPLAVLDEYEMVDPYQVHQEAMNRLIKERHFQDYQISAGESFVKEFGDLLTFDGKNPIPDWELKRNPFYYISNAKISGTALDHRAAAARASQLAIKNLFPHNTATQNAYEHIRGKLLASAYERWGEKYIPVINQLVPAQGYNLVNKMRGLAFHTTMGFFNPVQVLLQLQTLGAITAIAPKYALGATRMAWHMRNLDLMPGDLEVLKRVAKTATKLNPNWTEKQFVEALSTLRQTDFDHVGKTASYKNDLSDYNVFKGSVAKFLNWSPVFFNAAERQVRATAWNTAYKEYVDKFPGLVGKLDQNDIKVIGDRAEDLAINMFKNAHAPWQEGYMSIMTQFWGYAGRMFDLYTGNRLTGAEKARLIAFNSMAYGIPTGLTPFLPIWPWEDELRQMLMENNVNINEGIADAAVNGLLASTFSGITHAILGKEYQMDFSGRWGPNAITVLHDLMETRRNESGMDELLKVLGGASGTKLGKIIADGIPLVKDIGYTLGTNNEYGLGVIQQDAKTFLGNVSTFSSITKVWHAANVGVAKMKDGTVLDEDYDAATALFSAITGVEKQSVNDTFIRFRSTKEEQKDKEKVSNEAKRWMRLYFETEDVKLQEEYLAKIRATFEKEFFSTEQRQKIWENVMREKSLKTRSIEQFIKEPNDPQVEDARKELLGGEN